MVWKGDGKLRVERDHEPHELHEQGNPQITQMNADFLNDKDDTDQTTWNRERYPPHKRSRLDRRNGPRGRRRGAGGCMESPLYGVPASAGETHANTMTLQVANKLETRDAPPAEAGTPYH